MQPFTYTRVKEIKSAITGVPATDAKFLAGGTNLVDLMKLNIEHPSTLIDINALPMHDVKTLPNGGISIGALVTNTDLAYHPVIKEKYSVLSEAILSGASAQLRNRATVGGNLLQRTRCPYFYDTEFPCNKRVPGSGCPAIKGFNRNNAILGTSEFCIATHPSDMCVALAALGAVINISRPNGKRSVSFNDFYLKPGNTPHKENILAKHELIVSVDLPPLAAGTKSHYLKIRDRASYEFALTSAAVVLTVNDNNITHASIGLGGVGTIPWRSVEAEQKLQGNKATAESFQEAAVAAFANAKGYKYNQFKIELGKRTLVRALSTTASV